jgi:flagella basal body P-ring formation protein FlgA
MSTRNQFAVWVLAFTLSAGPVVRAGPGPQGASGELLLISLRATATAQGNCVLLKEVATFRGGSPELVERVAGLDVIDAPSAGKTTTISKEAIAFRLQLAGIDRRAFHLEGADQIVVGPPGPRFTADDLVAAARTQLLRHLPWPAADVCIQAAQPPKVPNVELGPDDQVSLEAELHSSGNVVGRMLVDVAVLVNGRRRAVVTVGLDVRLNQQLALASRRIGAGEVLSADNLKPDRRVVNGVSPYLTFAECAAGKRAKRAIPAGQLLAPADVEAEGAGKSLVKQHELVKLVAKVGAMRVTALGEALQDGSAGQFIRVKNVDSKNVVLGRVADRALVEVDY